MWIVRLALRRPYTFVVTALALLLLGAVTISWMPTDAVNALNDLPIKQVNGTMVYIRDVAQVRDGGAVQTNIVNQDGRPSTLLTVLKSGGASTLDVVKRVKDAIPRIQSTLPPALDLKFLNALDPTSRTLLTEVQLSNRDGTLLPGMYAQVKFVITRATPPWLIPANTLVSRADGSQVATVGADHKVHYQKVDIGRDYGSEVEIVSSLDGTASLVTNPTDALLEGTPVQVAPLSAKGGGPENAGE